MKPWHVRATGTEGQLMWQSGRRCGCLQGTSSCLQTCPGSLQPSGWDHTLCWPRWELLPSSWSCPRSLAGCIQCSMWASSSVQWVMWSQGHQFSGMILRSQNLKLRRFWARDWQATKGLNIKFCGKATPHLMQLGSQLVISAMPSDWLMSLSGPQLGLGSKKGKCDQFFSLQLWYCWIGSMSFSVQYNIVSVNCFKHSWGLSWWALLYCDAIWGHIAVTRRGWC